MASPADSPPQESTHAESRPRLRFLDGPDVGIDFELPAAGGTLGRSRASIVTLDRDAGTLVSGEHLRFYVQDSEWWIEDLRSKNGTWRNGERVHGNVRLQPDDEFVLGKPGCVGSVRFYVVFPQLRRRDRADDPIMPKLGADVTESKKAAPVVGGDGWLLRARRRAARALLRWIGPSS